MLGGRHGSQFAQAFSANPQSCSLLKLLVSKKVSISTNSITIVRLKFVNNLFNFHLKGAKKTITSLFTDSFRGSFIQTYGDSVQ